MNIAFRTDANPHIGMGHLSRCLAVAARLAQTSGPPLFIVADTAAADLIKSRGFPFLCLDSAYDDLESELDKLLAALADHPIQTLVIDSYFVTETYLRALRDAVRTVYIDDMNAFAYPVSLLINYNLYGPDMDYSPLQTQYNTHLLLGPAFAPLRKEFTGRYPVPLREPARQILVSTGGADPLRLGQKIARALLNAFDDITVHWVAGNFVGKPAPGAERLCIHQNVTAMADLMLSCDLAVSAAGSTLYELCACGIPTISYAFADNQLFGARAFAEKNLIPFAGDFRNSEPDCLSAILAAVAALRESPARRQEQSGRMRRLVDGQGAARIAEVVGRDGLRRVKGCCP